MPNQLGATVSISVPALPDNDVWFANAAAWSNYWEQVNAQVIFDAIATTAYVQSNFDATLQPINLQIDGADNIIITQVMFNSLRDDYLALKASYKNLRQQLYDAGLITTV